MTTRALDLLQVFLILQSKSNQNYLVGGCVRDTLMGLEPKDYDIVTDVPMEEVVEDFKKAGWKVEETGLQFLVLNVSKGGDRRFEIANFRKDGVYLDGRRPEKVEIGTIWDDAKRRDFTVNAIYRNPFSGQFVDPTGRGMRDVKERNLRFVGKPKERIREDYLRIFRFYRFLTRGFTADPRSLRACRELFGEAFANLNQERVREELEKTVGI